MRIKFSELQPGDIFMDAWDAKPLLLVNIITGPIVNADAPRSVELFYKDLSRGKNYSRSWNAEHLCNCLRPDQRDVDLARMNLTRG